MGWEDRPYYRDGNRTPGSIFRSILGGSVPFFTAFGIRVRIHASLIILIISVILFDVSKGYPLHDRLVSMGMLAIIIILHEFGHCFAARSVGGEARNILLWPLGGLAFAIPPRQPWPTFVTVAGGPAVNLLICAVCGIVIGFLGGGIVPFNPFHIYVPHTIYELAQTHYTAAIVAYYFFWLYEMSYINFLFNLIPMFPLDGGQMLQSILWPKFGHYRSMIFACKTGMVGAGALALLGLYNVSLLLICLAAAGFLYCRNRLTELRYAGPESEYGGDMVDYAASLRPDSPKKRRKVSRWTVNRLRKEAQRDATEQQTIDAILAKVSAQGMHTLTWSERRALKRATDRQRKRDLELSRRD